MDDSFTLDFIVISIEDLLKNLFLMFIFERQTEREQGGAVRGRHRIRSRLQTLSCQHRARRGARTHDLRDHVTEPKSDT